jgi:hypothetical protein
VGSTEHALKVKPKGGPSVDTDLECWRARLATAGFTEWTKSPVRAASWSRGDWGSNETESNQHLGGQMHGAGKGERRPQTQDNATQCLLSSPPCTLSLVSG